MTKVLRHLTLVFVAAGLLVAGCASKEFLQYRKLAQDLEIQHRYEEAYENYQKAYDLDPKDKEIQAKLRQLETIISEKAFDDGVRAFKDKKYKTALTLFDKSLKFVADNQRTVDYRSRAQAEYNAIRQRYKKAEALKDANNWLEAVRILEEIEASYHDDPDIGSRIRNWRASGYAYYMEAGLEARQSGEYSRFLRNIEAADSLNSDAQSQQALARAKEYVTADQYYRRAQISADRNNVIEAMTELIMARNIAADHIGVNRLMEKLKPVWSELIFEAGKRHIDAKQHDKAFQAFANLYDVNPQYPEAEKFYEQTRLTYLKNKYKLLVQAYNNNDFPQIPTYTQLIIEVDPSFLDTNEMMTLAVLNEFNVFYQRGLHYMETQNYGKAILCFRSAEKILNESQLTQNLIHQAWIKIGETSALRVSFWDFFQQIGDPRMSTHATGKLKSLLQARVEQKPFKNIELTFEEVKEKGENFRAGYSRDIDWGAVQSMGSNSIIAGDVKLLQVEKNRGSEWKTYTLTATKLVENDEYRLLSTRREQIKQGLDSDSIEWEKKNKLRSELRKIEKAILRIPPIKTIIVEEKKSYPIERHTLTAHVQIDLQIAKPDGSQVWPSKMYEDQYQVEDLFIPPNSESDDPKLSAGDDLSLPSDSEFKEQAIDHMMETIIYPDILKNFENYGMRFYEQASQLSSPEKPEHASMAFRNSIEEYYKFLASYEGKGANDNLTQKVEKFLDSCVTDNWLLGRRADIGN